MTRRRHEAEQGDALGLLEQKRRLRDRLRLRRKQGSPEEAARASERASQQLLEWTGFERARAVAFYAATQGELDLRFAFRGARERQKTCFFPRCNDAGYVEFVEVGEWETLRPGRYGIPEPGGSATALPAQGTLVLVPGVAFDREGNRLGMGRGYYDRTFPKTDRPGPVLVGVGFGWQIVERIPHGPADRVMDFLLTDDGVVSA